MAERQQPAEPTSESGSRCPASQSQRGSARPSVSSARATRVPRSWGVATAAPSAHSKSAPAARLLLLTLHWCTDPNCPHFLRRQSWGMVCSPCVTSALRWRCERGDRSRASPDGGGGSARSWRRAETRSTPAWRPRSCRWVCESMLTGPGGGGFMLVHHGGGDGRLRRLRDGPAARRSESELLRARGRLRRGHAAGVPHGRRARWRCRGRRSGSRRRTGASARWTGRSSPRRRSRLAREGVELTPAQGYLHRILDGLLRHSPEGDAMYGGRVLLGGRAVRAPGSRRDARADRGGGRAACCTRASSRSAICAHVPLTLEDLAGVRGRSSASRCRWTYRGDEFRSNPPPSSGGALIALGLAGARRRRAGRGGDRARDGGDGRGARRRRLGGTTHISVVDARGDAASLSCSLGSGSGVVVPGTGIHLNNMLGEADLTGERAARASG